MGAIVKPTFEVEEPIARDGIPVFPSKWYWTQFLQDIIARLEPLDGAVLPVKFADAKEAERCHKAMANRRNPSHRGLYASIPDALRSTQRRDRVFFWLENKHDAS